MHRFSSRSPIFNAALLRTFSAATRAISVVSKIGEREVNLRIILRLFCIHHFAVSSIAKSLIAAVRIVINTNCIWSRRSVCNQLHQQCSSKAIAPVYGIFGILPRMVIEKVEEVGNRACRLVFVL